MNDEPTALARRLTISEVVETYERAVQRIREGFAIVSAARDDVARTAPDSTMLGALLDDAV